MKSVYLRYYNVSTLIYLAGIVLTFFLSILLISKKGKTGADYILATWLFIIGVHLIFVYLVFSEKIFAYPALLGVNLPLPLFHGPFLFLYTAAVTNQINGFKKRAIHFLPVLLMYGLFLTFFLQPSTQKIEIYKREGIGYEVQMGVLITSIMVSGIVYVASSLWLLKKHTKSIQDQFSSTDKINLAWLRYLIYGIGVIWLFVFIGDDVIVFHVVVVFVFFLGYFGVNQVGIFSQKHLIEKSSGTTETQFILEPEKLHNPDVAIDNFQSDTQPLKEKYLRSSLSESSAIEIHTKLTHAMDEEKVFTNSDITLAELAEALDVHPNNLSQVINSVEGKSFYDYVNSKRIAEFKRIVALPGNQKFTLLGLAHDCGFNSKTSFNRNFKKATGLSPTDYLRKTHIELPV